MTPKIHHVTDNSGTIHLVRSFTKAGARRYVAAKLGQSLHGKLPSQDELLQAAQHTPIDDATVEPTPAAGPLNPVNQQDEE